MPECQVLSKLPIWPLWHLTCAHHPSPHFVEPVGLLGEGVLGVVRRMPKVSVDAAVGHRRARALPSAIGRPEQAQEWGGGIPDEHVWLDPEWFPTIPAYVQQPGTALKYLKPNYRTQTPQVHH